jgi:hypothetical protein
MSRREFTRTIDLMARTWGPRVNETALGFEQRWTRSHLSKVRSVGQLVRLECNAVSVFLTADVPSHTSGAAMGKNDPNALEMGFLFYPRKADIGQLALWSEV